MTAGKKNRAYSLHWLCNLPTPYNDFFFRWLAGDPEFDLTVHFRKDRSASHPWKKSNRQDFRSRTYGGKLDLQLIRHAAIDSKSFLIVAGWDNVTAQLVLSMLSLRGRPFAIWTDTPNVHRSRPVLKGVARGTWLRAVFSRASAVMGTGRPAVEALAQMGCPPEKLVNFPYWVPLPDVAAMTTHTAVNEKIEFMAAGVLEQRKGYDFAIDAFADAVRLFPNRRATITICGEGSERPLLEERIRHLHLEGKVALPGWQEPREIARRLMHCTAFIHPARWEPYGVAVLEAMASGKAVLGSDQTMAVLDRVQHGVNGMVHRTGDVTELATHIASFLRDPLLSSRLGGLARSTAEEWPVQRGIRQVKKLIANYL